MRTNIIVRSVVTYNQKQVFSTIKQLLSFKTEQLKSYNYQVDEEDEDDGSIKLLSSTVVLSRRY